MSYPYTQADLKSRMNAGIHGKQGILISSQDTMNDAARSLASRLHMKSLRRQSLLVPNMFNGAYDYAGPEDINGSGIIDLPAQALRYDAEYALVSPREFDVSPQAGKIAFDEFNNMKIVKINSKNPDTSIAVSELNNLSAGGGTWNIYGDATNLTEDTADFIKSTGSLSFDLAGASVSYAGIRNTTLTQFDITKYLQGDAAIFVFAKINSTVTPTSFTLKFGNDTSNYYSKTITLQSNGSAFVNGWQLLRFDLSSLSTVGAPDPELIDYMEIVANIATVHSAATGFKFNYMVLKKGKFSYIKYYSVYPWVDGTTGARKRDATSAGDKLVANAEEYQLFINECRLFAARELDLPVPEIDRMEKLQEKAIAEYVLNNPSEALTYTTEYETFTGDGGYGNTLITRG